jgi:hypothetical protein
MKQRKIIVVMLLLLCALPGCIQQSVGEAQVDFCQALDGYGDAVADLSDINAQTSVDELNTARENVAQSREELLDLAAALRTARLRYTEDAFANLEEELADIPGDTTLGEAANMARIEIAVLLTEIDRVYNISCGRR